MSELPGLKKPAIAALPRVRERMSFIYLEHCEISRQDSAITAMDARGTVHIPAASLAVLMLGPGTSVSHRAMVIRTPLSSLLSEIQLCTEPLP